MAIWQIFKVSRRTFFNPTAWLNISSIRDTTSVIWNNIRGEFVVPPAGREESFEAARKRYGLSEQDIQAIEKNYHLYSIIFLIIGIVVFLFTLYLLFFHATLTGFLLGVVASGLFIAQAFRFSFWHFQIRYRKLGCTFAEWRRGKPDENGGPPHA